MATKEDLRAFSSKVEGYTKEIGKPGKKMNTHFEGAKRIIQTNKDNLEKVVDYMVEKIDSQQKQIEELKNKSNNVSHTYAFVAKSHMACLPPTKEIFPIN